MLAIPPRQITLLGTSATRGEVTYIFGLLRCVMARCILCLLPEEVDVL